MARVSCRPLASARPQAWRSMVGWTGKGSSAATSLAASGPGAVTRCTATRRVVQLDLSGRQDPGRCERMPARLPPDVEQRHAVDLPDIARGRSGGRPGFVSRCRPGAWPAPAALWGAWSLAGSGRPSGSFRSIASRLLGFVRALGQRVPAQRPQLLEAAADLAALLRLVAAHGVEALEVEGGQRVGLLPLEAGLRRAELGRGVEQRDLDPLGALALPERDREPPRDPGLDLALGATSAMRRAVSSSSSDGASSSRTRWCMAVRPCLSALREARALPSSVTGPRERAPLRREASIWAGERAAGMAVVRGDRDGWRSI